MGLGTVQWIQSRRSCKTVSVCEWGGAGGDSSHTVNLFTKLSAHMLLTINCEQCCQLLWHTDSWVYSLGLERLGHESRRFWTISVSSRSAILKKNVPSRSHDLGSTENAGRENAGRVNAGHANRRHETLLCIYCSSQRFNLVYDVLLGLHVGI